MVVTGRSTDQVTRARVLGPDRCDAMGMHAVPALTLIYLTYTNCTSSVPVKLPTLLAILVLSGQVCAGTWD
eukprot:SAG31_NODE_1850_length_7082_cov_7.264786_5_plen_71_part_00